MQPEDILDAIGNVEDNYIRKAKEKNMRAKKLWISFGTIAACVTLVAGIPFIYATDWFTGDTSPNPRNENIGFETTPAPGHSQLAFEYIEVYYAFSNKTKIAPRKNIVVDRQKQDDILELLENITESRTGETLPKTDSDDDIHEDDYVINFKNVNGNIVAEYVLNKTVLYDYQSDMKYTLTEEEAEALRLALVK